VCGIYGVVSVTSPSRTDPKILQDMAATLVHRGPDGGGTFVDDNAALGVRLLRIIDRANPITQPFRDPATGVVVVCNGEIYNSPEIRARYRDFPFRTASDVESIVPLFLDKGRAGITDLDGMYSLAIWDPRTREIILARDPQGEKPLFAANVDGLLVFGSEIQTILAHPGVGTSANTSAIEDILTLGYTVGAKTMFEGIWSVEPGSAGKVAGSTWNYEPATGTRPVAPDDPSGSLDTLLEAAVARQLNAEVPVGVFASGGVDSSLLAAYATQAMAPTKLHTFAIGFEEPSYDERDPARAVARHLGTHHIDVLATAKDLAAQLHTMIDRLAEPITDPAVLPTALLAARAQRHVGVVLSGEGADELFGGYPTYLGHAAAAGYGRLPSAVRSVIDRIVDSLPVSDTKVPIRLLLKRFVAHASKPALDRHVAWFGAQVHDRLLPPEVRKIWDASIGRFDDLSRFMYFDYSTYLRALLAKIDRATMLSSLESRAPFLDPLVRRFAFALPDHLKTDGLRTKPLLKHVASRYLPRRIVHIDASAGCRSPSINSCEPSSEPSSTAWFVTNDLNPWAFCHPGWWANLFHNTETGTPTTGVRSGHYSCSGCGPNTGWEPDLMNRDEALALMHQYTESAGLRAHMYAIELAMRAYARKFGENEDEWGLVGLLHDFDYEKYPNDARSPTEQHPSFGVNLLRERGFPEHMCEAILGHAVYCDVPRESQMAKTLFAVDELCGLLVACVLVRPSKSFGDLKVKSVKKKLKDKGFARGVNREEVRSGAEELGVELDEHIQFLIDALAPNEATLGLGAG